MPADKAANLNPPVRTTAQARALAARRDYGPIYGETLKPKQIKIFESQHAELARRGPSLEEAGLDASKLIRKLLGEYFEANPLPGD